MDRQELNRYCWLITSTVERWLVNKDELTKALHATAVETIRIAPDVNLDAFLHIFKLHHSHLVERYGKKVIREEAKRFLSSDFSELSTLFAFFYEEFNKCYFAGDLPPFRVSIRHRSYRASSSPNTLEAAHLRRGRREIALVYNGWPEAMLALFIRVMAFVRTGFRHGAPLDAELCRLHTLGAPRY